MIELNFVPVVVVPTARRHPAAPHPWPHPARLVSSALRLRRPGSATQHALQLGSTHVVGVGLCESDHRMNVYTERALPAWQRDRRVCALSARLIVYSLETLLG